jgi:hypothetical protein
MPPTLTSTSGKQYRTLEEKIEVIAKISFPSNPADIPTIAQDTQEPEESGGNTDSTDGTAFTVCPKMLKQLLMKTCNTSAPGLDGIGWWELKIWFKLDPKGLCKIINELIKTGLPSELKVARVVVIMKPGRRDRTEVKSYPCISLLPTIGKLVEMLYTNKLYSKILHPVTDEVTMLQTSNTRSYTLSRSSNTRSYIILRASNTKSYITLRASNTQGYIILRTSNTRSYTCHGRVTYEVTNFHRRITHDHTRVTQQVHRYYY